MNLYISPLSCSLTAHIASLEAGLPVTLQRVDRKTKQLDDGRDFRTISPQAVVPVIELPTPVRGSRPVPGQRCTAAPPHSR